MRLWHLFVPFIAISSLGAGYDAWRKSPPSKATEARRECFTRAEDMGLRRSDSVQLCNCLLGKARWYKWTHWGAEYTREVHLQLGKECVSQMLAASAASPSSGFATFISDAPRSTSYPAASRPLTGPGSGWGEAPEDSDDPYTSPPSSPYGGPDPATQ